MEAGGGSIGALNAWIKFIETKTATCVPPNFGVEGENESPWICAAWPPCGPFTALYYVCHWQVKENLS